MNSKRLELVAVFLMFLAAAFLPGQASADTTLTMPLVNNTGLPSSDYTVYVLGFSTTSTKVLAPVSAGSSTLSFQTITSAEPGIISSYVLGTGPGQVNSIQMVFPDSFAPGDPAAIDGGRIYFFIANNTTFPTAPQVQYLANFAVVQPTNPPHSVFKTGNPPKTITPAPPFMYVEFTYVNSTYGWVADVSTVDGFTFPISISISGAGGALYDVVGQPLDNPALNRNSILAAYAPFMTALAAEGGNDYLVLQYADTGGDILLNPYYYLIETDINNNFTNLTSPLHKSFDSALTTLFSNGSLLTLTGDATTSIPTDTYTGATITATYPGATLTHQAIEFTGVNTPANTFTVFNPVGFSILTYIDSVTGLVTPITGTIVNTTLTFDTALPAGTLQVGLFVNGNGIAIPPPSIISITPGIDGKIVSVGLSGPDLNTPAPGQYQFCKAPNVNLFSTSGTMVFGCTGLLADSSTETGDRLTVLQGLQRDIGWSLNVGTANGGHTTAYWKNEANYYPPPAPTAIPQNLFSLFLHTATLGDASKPIFTRASNAVSSARGTTMAMAYGFAYDETPPVGPQVPSKWDPLPGGGTSVYTAMTVTLGTYASSNATVTSTTYTVSAGGTSSETITNVPPATAKAVFLAALTMGDPSQTWNSTAIADPVVTGNTLVVTSPDGTTMVTYTVTVSVPSSDKAILTYTILGNGTVDEGAKTVAVTVPFGTDVTTLVPTITVSPLATVSPLSGVANNFTTPKIYTVTAEDGISTQNYTVTVTALAQVMSLTASQGGYSDRIRLKWATVGGATGYEIWRSDVNNVGLSEKIVTADASPYDDMLAAGSSYKFYYWVRAVSTNYTGAFSDYAYGTLTDSSIINLKNGTAVTGISGTLGSMRTYTIVVPDNQEVFEVIASGGTGDCDINVGIGESGSRRYSIRSTASENIQYENPEGGTYYINVYAKTAYSGVTFLARFTSAKPLTPTNLVASKGTFADKIVLTWTASPCATSYDVYRAMKIGTTVPKFTDAGPSYATVAGTEYEDTEPSVGEVWYYWLKAVNPAGSNNPTAAAIGNVMPAPTAPGSVTASKGTYFDKVRLTWAKMANVTSYEVYRTADGTYAEDMLVGTVETSNLASYTLDDSTVPKNTYTPTLYYYWLKAINSNQSSVSAKPASGYVSNKGPATITATKGTVYQKVRVTWAAVSGATSYDIYKAGVLLKGGVSSPYEDNTGNTTSYGYNVIAKYDKVAPAVHYASAPSLELSGYGAAAPTTLAAPVLKSVSTNLYDYVLVTWAEVPKAQTYRIYRGTGTLFKNAVPIEPDVSTLTYSDVVELGGISAGVKYYYWVKAVNGSVLSLNPSASMTGMAAADVPGANVFANPAGYPNGQNMTVAADAVKGSVKYYSIVVPTGTTRLVATLSGATTAVDDCDVYAKLGCYPTTVTFNAKGVENKTNEVLTVSNPANGTWYFMPYGAGTAGYTARTLNVACYNAADIYLTSVPAGDLNVPFTSTFKGKVVDKSGTGIGGLTLMARSPITGISSYLTAKTDANGVFTYSEVISTEGEHTFDFFFTEMPDLAKGTASHTVFTKNTSLYASNFDFSAYLRATLLPLSTGVPDDLAGVQAFLNTSNGWDDNAVNPIYQTMWIGKTIGAVQSDTALLGKIDSGLYLFLYGVEGAGTGNDTANNPGTSGSIPVSGLSTAPFIVHVDDADKTAVLARLLAMGIIDNATNGEIAAGQVGVVAIASFSAAGNNISLSASEQLNLLLNIANSNLVTLPGGDGKYSGVLTKQFEVSVGTTAGDRKINVITSSFIPDMTAIVEDE